jgi:AAA domain
MSINLPALLAVFPSQATSSVQGNEQNGLGPRGAFPYDALKTHLPEAIGVELMGPIEYMRLNPDWRDVFAGDLAGYGGDHSRADLAVCGELARQGLQAEVIDTVFRASGLYRPKWEREDYRNGTIGKGLATAGIKPRAAPTVTGLLDPQNGMIAISTAAPQPREYTVEDLLVPAKSVVLAGFGGTSKTQLAFHLAVSIALGTPFAGKTVKQGSVMMCLGEEDREEIGRRINAIVRKQSFNASQIQLMVNNIRAFPLVGHDTRLAIKSSKALTEGKFGDEIIDGPSHRWTPLIRSVEQERCLDDQNEAGVRSRIQTRGRCAA